MSKHSAALVAVGAIALFAVLNCPRHRPCPSAHSERESPTPTPEHVRAVGKALVTDDLIGGRATLSEAAARFRELERLAELPGFRAAASASVRPGPWFDEPPTTEADRLYLRVLAHIKAGVEFTPLHISAETFARLEREYRRLRFGGRPLIPPDLMPGERDEFLAQVRQATLRAASGQLPILRIARLCGFRRSNPKSCGELSRLTSPGRV
jgi:hypothetical protein